MRVLRKNVYTQGAHGEPRAEAHGRDAAPLRHLQEEFHQERTLYEPRHVAYRLVINHPPRSVTGVRYCTDATSQRRVSPGNNNS